MGLRQPKLGESKPGRRRLGVDFAKFRGMLLDTDPGAIPPGAHRMLENVDFLGELAPRQGLRNQNEEPFLSDEACISFGSDYQTDILRLFIVAKGCPGVSTSVGRSVGFFDPDFSASFQRVLYYDWTTTTTIVAPYSGELYAATGPYLRRVVRVQTPVGVEPITVTGIRQDVNIFFFSGYSIKSMWEFNGLLFIGAELDSDPTQSVIYSYDGLVMRIDRSGVVCPTFMIQYQETLVMGYADFTLNKLTVRDKTGTYTDIAGGGTHMACVAAVSHQTFLFIADGVDTLWKFDGAAITSFRNVAGATFFNAVESFNGFLYYGYSSGADPTKHGHIGRWIEAAVFEDNHHDMTVQDATVHSVDVLRGYRGRLFAACRKDASSSKLYASDSLDTGADYEEISDTASIEAMLVF